MKIKLYHIPGSCKVLMHMVQGRHYCNIDSGDDLYRSRLCLSTRFTSAGYDTYRPGLAL